MSLEIVITFIEDENCGKCLEDSKYRGKQLFHFAKSFYIDID